MTRQIKFRAWDTKNNQMVNNVCVCNGIAYPTPLKDSIGTRIMQYTGLHDKNGNEIYEGDVLLNKDVVMSISEHIFVEWKEGFWSCFRLYEESEIIGNIYENPNLIN